MRFQEPLSRGRLLRRYKRFLADVLLDDGREVTAHCANTGAMLGCDRPGARVWLSRSDNPERKLAWTWELVEAAPGVIVGIHTGRTNDLVAEALARARIPRLAGYPVVRREVRVGDGRVDFVLHGTRRRDCVLEVKNVTAAVSEGIALFPDAVSARATRHLGLLAGQVAAGRRAVLLFCVQRDDVREVRPADGIDPVYGRALREAARAGVELMAWGCRVAPDGIEVVRRLRVRLPRPGPGGVI